MKSALTVVIVVVNRLSIPVYNAEAKIATVTKILIKILIIFIEFKECENSENKN